MASLREFVRQLKADCSTVESTVLHQHLASPDECKAAQPGGMENPEKGPRGWLSYYRWLHRRHAVNELRDSPNLGTEGLQGDVLDALSARPERVLLVVPIECDGASLDALTVYPKAFGPLIWCHQQSLKLGYLAGHVKTLARSAAPGDREVVVQGWERIGRLHRQLVWAATAQGPGLPFDRTTEPDPEPPAWTLLVDTIDLHRIIQAYQRVHGSRLVALDKLLPPTGERTQSPAMWATFAVGAAEALGIRVSDLTEAISFPEVVARLRTSAHTQQTAMEAAKAKAAAGRER